VPEEIEEIEETEEIEENGHQVMELDQEQLEAMIDRRAEARAQELLAAREPESRQMQLELARLRRRDHESTVRERIAEHQERGVPVAILTRAAELMLADDTQETVLELSRDDETVSLSATDIVLDMLAAIPSSSLELAQPRVPKNRGKAPEDDDARTAKEKAEDLLKDLKDGEVVRVPSY
jgi:hypothetical protein